jgi:hypothetical protein
MSGKDCTTIVRFSVDYARIVERNGGKIQPLAKGHAEVLDAKGCAVGYLTKRDFKRYELYYNSFTHYSDLKEQP